MTCPNWQALAEARERLADSAGTGVDEVEREWRMALDHRRECPSCRLQSRLADPLTLFQEMPGIELEPGAIETMQQRVAGARRWLRSDAREASYTRSSHRWRWPATLAAAILVLALGLAVSWPRRSALGAARLAGLLEGTIEASDRIVDDRSQSTADEAKQKVLDHLVSLPPVEGQMEVTFRVEGGSFELVQLGSLGH